jgi:hypothetical protein
VYGAEATATNLLFDGILVYPVDGRTVVVAAAIVRARIERLFDSSAARGCSTVVSYRALVCGHRHVLDHLRTTIVGGGREIDMDAMAR